MDPVTLVVGIVVIGLLVGGGYIIYIGIQRLRERQEEAESH